MDIFATSHGKSPCDGIGGTVKRLTARASLQRPLTDQILSADAMFRFCKESIEGISFYFISRETMAPVREELAERFSCGSTVPGTRSSTFLSQLNHTRLPTSAQRKMRVTQVYVACLTKPQLQSVVKT